jgi:transcriptional regulator with XRE-family HTH domain
MVRRRQLAAALRAFRIQAGLSVTEAAERLLSAPSKISRIENGQRNATPRDVRDLSEAYTLSSGIRDQLMELARESRQHAWWQEGDLDPALQTLIGMEGAAKSIKEFEPLLMPGLLQIQEYARAVVDVPRLGKAAAEAVLAARMRRRHILEQEIRPQLRVILDEAVIRRTVGGPAVMRQQLQHLVTCIDRKQVELQIIPFTAGAPPIGALNGFVLLEFDEPVPTIPEAAIPGVVYVETLMADTYYDQPAEVEHHLRVFTALGGLALSATKSRDFLLSVSGTM